MPGLQTDGDTAKVEKLKAALWYSIGETIESLSLEQDINASSHFIGALSEMCWAQLENVARDLESFAKHDGSRSIISAKDVMLLVRRNDALEQILKREAEAAKYEGRG